MQLAQFRPDSRAGILFGDKMNGLTKKLGEQMVREKELDEEIKKQLARIGFVI